MAGPGSDRVRAQAGGASSARPEPGSATYLPHELIPTSLLWGKLPLEKRRLRKQIAEAGFIQATWCWYHPEHWEWAPHVASGYRYDLHKVPLEDWLARSPVRGRLIVRDEAYRPLSKAAQRWMKERVSNA